MSRANFVLVIVLLSLLSWGHGYAAALEKDPTMQEFLELVSTAFLAAVIAFAIVAGTSVRWGGE
jgi:hypothetical protein